MRRGGCFVWRGGGKVVRRHWELGRMGVGLVRHQGGGGRLVLPTRRDFRGLKRRPVDTDEELVGAGIAGAPGAWGCRRVAGSTTTMSRIN